MLCPVCGKAFKKRHHKHRYCSLKCQRKSDPELTGGTHYTIALPKPKHEECQRFIRTFAVAVKMGRFEVAEFLEAYKKGVIGE